MHFQVSPMLADTGTHNVLWAFEPHYLQGDWNCPARPGPPYSHWVFTPAVRTALPHWQHFSQEIHMHVGLGSCARAVGFISHDSRSCCAPIQLLTGLHYAMKHQACLTVRMRLQPSIVAVADADAAALQEGMKDPCSACMVLVTV